MTGDNCISLNRHHPVDMQALFLYYLEKVAKPVKVIAYVIASKAMCLFYAIKYF